MVAGPLEGISHLVLLYNLLIGQEGVLFWAPYNILYPIIIQLMKINTEASSWKWERHVWISFPNRFPYFMRNFFFLTSFAGLWEKPKIFERIFANFRFASQNLWRFPEIQTRNPLVSNESRLCVCSVTGFLRSPSICQSMSSTLVKVQSRTAVWTIN